MIFATNIYSADSDGRMRIRYGRTPSGVITFGPGERAPRRATRDSVVFLRMETKHRSDYREAAISVERPIPRSSSRTDREMSAPVARTPVALTRSPWQCAARRRWGRKERLRGYMGEGRAALRFRPPNPEDDGTPFMGRTSQPAS